MRPACCQSVGVSAALRRRCSCTDAENSAAERMHMYEVLQPHQPVRLYMDIDAEAQTGIQYDSSLPSIISEHLQLVWPLLSNAGQIKVQCEVASCHRKNKFSIHVVAHVWVGATAVLFESNLALLPFIRLLKRECANNAFIQSIDETVYSRNRLMRTLYSAKKSAVDFPFVPEPGSSRQICDHLIVGAHAYEKGKATLVLTSDDCAEGVLPLCTPRPGFKGGSFDAEKVVLPPHAQKIIELLSETIAVGTVTQFVSKGVGGIMSFSSLDRAYPCSLFTEPRPHKGNNLRFVLIFACTQQEDSLLQYCHDDHCRYPTQDLFQRAVDGGKICSVCCVDYPPAWGGDLRVMVPVELPQSVRAYCETLRQPTQVSNFSCFQ